MQQPDSLAPNRRVPRREILSFNPRQGTRRPVGIESTPAEVNAAVAAASSVHLDRIDLAVRARWIRAVADEMSTQSERLVAIAERETALGEPRLTGELTRAAAALNFYADVVADGAWLQATIDLGTETSPDLRRVKQPVGPVAVFGASNFPFGFGVLGHDFATALGAGCPVVIKTHPAHPELSIALGEVATTALAASGAPAGCIGMVHGMAAGAQLVTHPQIKAVAFTGSQAGGLALWQLAAERPEPIPVFAEMGTVNAVIVTRPGAAQRADEIASGFVASFTNGFGQFCTKPGLLLAPSGTKLPALLAQELQQANVQGWLLTEAISNAYSYGRTERIAAGAQVLASTGSVGDGCSAEPTLLQVDPELLSNVELFRQECFGPLALFCEYQSDEELARLINVLPNSLAAAVQGTVDDDPDVVDLVCRLQNKVGRVIVNAWPTGVATTWSQQHGGPWPATSVSSATSVGAAAIDRFTRPVAYQGVPEAALPEPLRAVNTWHIPRRVNGANPTRSA